MFQRKTQNHEIKVGSAHPTFLALTLAEQKNVSRCRWFCLRPPHDALAGQGRGIQKLYTVGGMAEKEGKFHGPHRCT
jgi:hypothetical protein